MFQVFQDEVDDENRRFEDEWTEKYSFILPPNEHKTNVLTLLRDRSVGEKWKL